MRYLNRVIITSTIMFLMTKRYQELVIKDGRFVGKFEEMYQEFDDPWSQVELKIENNISRQIVINYVNKYKISSLVEIGCGLGKTTNFISSNCKADILGVDISKTAINKAKNNYPALFFEVGDVRDIEKFFLYDCIFFSEITWYLLEDNLIDYTFEKMLKGFTGKFFIHNLVFYKGQQKYGLEYFDSLNKFIKYCPFHLLGKVEIDLADSDCIETSCIFRV